MRPLPRFVGKAAAVALLAAVLALTGAALSPILRTFHDNEAAIAERRQMLGRLEAIAAYADELETLTQGRNGGDEEFLTGAGDALIAADLLARLKTIAAENGASITSARPARMREESGFDLIGLRIDLTGPMPAVHATLRAIEANVPPLFVDHATFRAEWHLDEEAHEAIGLSVQFDVLGAVPRERPNRAGERPES